MTAVVVTAAALAAGMHVDGNGVDLVGLIGLGLLVNVVAALWGCGVAMFLRTEQAGPLIQMPIFVILFLAPVYVPLRLLTGWIHTVASVNPATAFVTAGARLHLRRDAFLGDRVCQRRRARHGDGGVGDARAAPG